MSNTESLYQELVNVTKEFAASSIDDLYHSEEKKEEARELREWYKNHPLKFEDLNLEQRRELGFGTWSYDTGEYELIPLWVFRLLDPEQILICPLYHDKKKIARVKNCNDDTRGGVVAFQFHRNPTEEELKKLEKDEKKTKGETVVTLGDLLREALKEGKATKIMSDSIVQGAVYGRSETKLIPSEEESELASGAQLIADLTWNARRNTPKVDVQTVIDLTRNLAKFGFSEVTITLPGGLYEDEARRYAEGLLDELEKRGFKASWYDSENGEDNDIHIDWSHLLKD